MAKDKDKLTNDTTLDNMQKSLKELKEKGEVLLDIDKELIHKKVKIKKLETLQSEMQATHEVYKIYRRVWMMRYMVAIIINAAIFSAVAWATSYSNRDVILTLLMAANFMLLASLPLSKIVAMFAERKIDIYIKRFTDTSKKFYEVLAG